MDTRIYTSESSLKTPRVLIGQMWKDLMAGRELAWRLAVRDISAMYRQSFLGILWAFIQPLANTLTWVFLNSTGLVAVGETDIPYPVYVFTGTMIWSIFTESMNAPIQKTTQNKAMLAKINFPREAIVLSGIYQSLFNGGIKVGLMIAALLLLGVYPGWNLLLFPLAFFSLILAGTAVGLLLTPVGMLYTDIGRGVPILMQFFMYLTPVVFPMPKQGLVATIVTCNPVTPLIMTTRAWLTGGQTDFIAGFIWGNVAVLAPLFLAWAIYRAAMPIIIERMSS